MSPRSKHPALDLAQLAVIAFIVITGAIVVGSLLDRGIQFALR